MKPARLVSRVMLERLADELTEWPLATHREPGANMTDALALLITAGPGDVYAGCYAVQELLKLALRRGDDVQRTVDPAPPARVKPARLRGELAAMRDHLALALDLVDAVLAAVPADGAA